LSGRRSRGGSPGLVMESRVQLLLNRLLQGGLKRISPSLNPEEGYSYPQLEDIAGAGEAEELLERLVAEGLLFSETCGFIACCPDCGSNSLKARDSESGWRCDTCGADLKASQVTLKPLHCYGISDEGVSRASRWLIANPIIDFLRERGYRTESPGTLLGESEVRHSFDIVAFSGGADGGALVVDFFVSDALIGEDQVKAMFAKVFDATPLRSVLVAFPGLTEDARRLAEQYRLSFVETTEADSLWKKLLAVIPPVDDFGYESLDVMTLLSLPDHLRKTATVVSSLGVATAEEIAEGTSRARAVESGYLNQLVRMGYLKKEREGRRVLFSVVS